MYFCKTPLHEDKWDPGTIIQELFSIYTKISNITLNVPSLVIHLWYIILNQKNKQIAHNIAEANNKYASNIFHDKGNLYYQVWKRTIEPLHDMFRQKYITCIMWQINAVGKTITYQKLLCCAVLYYIGDDKGFYDCWLNYECPQNIEL